MKLIKLVRRVDVLVKPFQFNVHNRKRTQTFIGGAFSICLFISYLLYAISLYIRQTDGQNSIYAGTQSDLQMNQGLDEQVVKFALELSSISGVKLFNYTEISNYLKIEVAFINQTRNMDIIGFERNETNLSMKKCNKEYIDDFNFYEASLTESQKEQLMCFEGQFNISGQFYDPIFQYVKIKISICDNSVNPQCKSIDEIKDFVQQGINIDLFIKGAKIKKQLNITSPAVSFPRNMFWRLTTGIANNEDIFIAPIQIDLKKNNLFGKLTNEQPYENIFYSSNVYRTERRQESTTFEPGAFMCSFYIRASLESFYYFSNSQDWAITLLSTVSETTSLIMTLIRILQFFYGFYNKHKTFETLINQVFKFDMSKSNQQEKDGEIINYGNLRTESQKNIFIKKQKLDKLINFTIQYSMGRYILYKFSKFFLCLRKFNLCRLAEEEEITISQMAKYKIQKDLDLTNILQKLYEIDCLKLLLFDDDQLMMFNAFSSPVFEDNMTKQINIKELISKQNRKSLRKQTFSKVDFSLVTANDIPFNSKLLKLSRFFRAQIVPQNAEELTQTFTKIYDNMNENSKKNQRILKFAQSNYTLYKIVLSYSLAKTSLFGDRKTIEVQSSDIEERQDVKNMKIHMRGVEKQYD